MHKVPVGVLGASGYAGRELCGLIARHPKLELAFASANEQRGQRARLGAAEVTYVATEDVASAPRRISDERLRRILADIPVTVGRSGLILLITGSPGTASVIAQAIDDSTLHEQEGTLAGDNTLLVLFADESRLERWLGRFEEIRSEPAFRPTPVEASS